jgi:hypothetical protein
VTRVTTYQLDGEGGLVGKCFKAGEELVARLLAVAVEKEAALSNEARGKKVIKKDVMLAYDTLDKVPLSFARSR